MVNKIFSIQQVTIILLSLFYGLTTLSASELEEILKSQEMLRYGKSESQSLQTLESERWLPGEENFSEIFIGHDSWKKINLWFDIPATGHYRRQYSSNHSPAEFVYTNRTYLTSDNKSLKVEVFVPHPRYKESVRYGLITALAERSPPQLEVEFTEETKIQKYPGKLYTLPDRNCQINLELTKATLIIFTAPCSHTDQLLDFAHQFSFDRFVMKLDT